MCMISHSEGSIIFGKKKTCIHTFSSRMDFFFHTCESVQKFFVKQKGFQLQQITCQMLTDKSLGMAGAEIHNQCCCIEIHSQKQLYKKLFSVLDFSLKRIHLTFGQKTEHISAHTSHMNGYSQVTKHYSMISLTSNKDRKDLKHLWLRTTQRVLVHHSDTPVTI